MAVVMAALVTEGVVTVVRQLGMVTVIAEAVVVVMLDLFYLGMVVILVMRMICLQVCLPG